MLKERYYIKIVPHRGETVHRFQIARAQIVAAVAIVAAVVLGSFLYAQVQAARVRAEVTALRQEEAAERARLRTIDRSTAVLRKQLQAIQKQNAEIQQLIGVHVTPPPPAHRTSWVPQRHDRLEATLAEVRQLAVVSERTAAETARLRAAALRVLNLRHMRALARASMLAAIPSIDPVEGAPVIGCFCYRTYPDVEFHEGVDLGADYGDPVRAAAAGTIAFAGWDGGYGLKVVIDHGNGYQTWYAHLSRIDVSVGQHVYKGELIAQVGATGFATGPHLHYQIMRDGVPIDPTPYLHGVPASVVAAIDRHDDVAAAVR
jgi:murein DD-endopeptidase MepM/ murein hydrolase activator NlpD